MPPLFDRYSGYDSQIAAKIQKEQYELGIVEHFWCASYAPLLRRHCRRLVLDLHNIESELAQTHAIAAKWPASWASARFAQCYRRLEREWLPQFDMLLAASEDDRQRIEHPHCAVFPNALPELNRPDVPEEDCIAFSGNLEYHPNIEAVRWFRSKIWPVLRESCPGLEWRLIGKNPQSVAGLIEGDCRIRATGPVEDAVAELAKAKVCVVPLRSGSGTRFKILEAWAAARAVVSTSIGAEGLCAVPGEHLLIANDAGAFAAAVGRALDNSALRRTLGEAGRALYLSQFTWPSAWGKLAEAGL
ncbi:MAG TPA: glycosyltransferase [Bryobacteraceae bacterium]|nr:glycosyltransferase [Bryobacteraceae bacterium]